MHFFQPGNNERILNWCINDQWKVHFIVRKSLVGMTRHIHRNRFVIVVAAIYHDPVFQSRIPAEFTLQRFGQEIYIMLFKILIKKTGWVPG